VKRRAWGVTRRHAREQHRRDLAGTSGKITGRPPVEQGNRSEQIGDPIRDLLFSPFSRHDATERFGLGEDR
jgi:hypothetical protein